MRLSTLLAPHGAPSEHNFRFVLFLLTVVIRSYLRVNDHMSPLDDALKELEKPGVSIRGTTRLHNVKYETLRRHHTSRGQVRKAGREASFSPDEENMLVKSLLEFTYRGTPLSREVVKHLIAHFVSRLPSERRSKLQFKQGRPGKRFISNFISRHSEINLNRRAALEQSRAHAMSANNLAMHFARLQKVYQEFGIVSGAQVFNLHESGFSTRRSGRGLIKAVMRSSGRSNAIDLEWSRNVEHITLMPVVSADGTAWNPVAILPGVRTKHRTRRDGTQETPAFYLPTGTYVSYRDPAGMASTIFFNWAVRFIAETESIRRTFKYIVIVLDGFAYHTGLDALKLLADNNIIFVAFSARSSNRTQTLDYTVFSPFKSKVTSILNERIMHMSGTTGELRNDAYTLCEIVHDAYKEAVTYRNIVNGFRACGIWNAEKGGADPDVIRECDLTNIEGHSDRTEAFKSFKELVTSFARSGRVLRSDGVIKENGTICTTSGALLTAEEVLSALSRRAEERAALSVQRAARAAELNERLEAREWQHAERERMRVA